MDKKILIGGVFLGILFAGVVVYFLMQGSPKQDQTSPQAPPPSAPSPSPREEPEGLGEQLYEQVQSPAERVPETNPFDANTNPFEDAKTNPFEGGYKNPFE